MAVQKDESLTEPLNSEETPRLYSTHLKPSLSQASLNLIIDYKRTLQSDLNKKMFWSFKTWSLLILCVSIYSYIKFVDHLKYQTFDKVLRNREFKVQIFYMFIAIVMIISMSFALLGEFTRFLKEEADIIADKPELTFGFDLNKYASLPDDEEEFKLVSDVKKLSKKEYELLLKQYKEELSHGENTQLIVYRDIPIALITISKDPELTRDDQYVVKIKGLGVRRVYANTGLQKDLIQWTYLRARDLYIKDGALATLKDEEEKPLRIFIELYNFENKIISVLKELPGWHLIQSKRVDDFVVGTVYGVEKQIWGVGMNITLKNK